MDYLQYLADDNFISGVKSNPVLNLIINGLPSIPILIL